MEPRGIFVIKDKENAVAQIEHLCKNTIQKNAANNVQSVALFKAYCRETISMLETCFATEMQRCHPLQTICRSILYTDDINNTQAATIQIFDMLMQLRNIAQKCNPDKGSAVL